MIVFLPATVIFSIFFLLIDLFCLLLSNKSLPQLPTQSILKVSEDPSKGSLASILPNLRRKPFVLVMFAQTSLELSDMVSPLDL